MRNFESQLSAFGKHRYTETLKQTRPIINPRKRERSLLWITTPAAAMVGILIGLGIQLNTNFNDPMTIQTKENKTKTIKQVVELYYRIKKDRKCLLYGLKNTCWLI